MKASIGDFKVLRVAKGSFLLAKATAMMQRFEVCRGLGRHRCGLTYTQALERHLGMYWSTENSEHTKGKLDDKGYTGQMIGISRERELIITKLESLHLLHFKLGIQKGKYSIVKFSKIYENWKF